MKPITKHDLAEIVEVYRRAWTTQDPDLIITIFTETAEYRERVFEEPHRGHQEIQDYWYSKVVESQRDIKCEILNIYLDGTTAVVEWEAEFDDLVRRVRKRMREVAILEFEGKRIASLREYWSTKVIADLETADELIEMIHP